MDYLLASKAKQARKQVARRAVPAGRASQYHMLESCLGQRAGMYPESNVGNRLNFVSVFEFLSRLLHMRSPPPPLSPRLGGRCFWQEGRSISSPPAADREVTSCSAAFHSIDSNRSCRGAEFATRKRGWTRLPAWGPEGRRSRRRGRSGTATDAVVVLW